MSARRLLSWAAAVAALAVVLWLVYGPGEPGYDAHFSLVWGDQLRHLNGPDYAAPLSPTPHPLSNAIGALASLFGSAGPDVLLALSYLAFAALGAAAFAAGRASFGLVTGIGFAALLLTRPLLVGETLDATIDVPFLALVLAALAVEQSRPRRGAAVLVLLAVAGLLRPEAWLLSIAYVAWLRRPRLVPLALAAPVVWLAFDLITAGDALQSITRTQDLAATLQRRRGLGTALSDIPSDLEAILGSEIVWAGLAVALIALWFAQSRAWLPVVVLFLGLAGFVALGVADLPLLTRYLLVPGAMLTLFCAAGLGAPEWLAPRVAGWALGAAVLVAVVLSVPNARDEIDARRDSLASQRAVDSALVGLLERVPRGCAPVQVATYRAVPLVAYRLGLDPSDVHVIRPARARGGVVLTGSPATLTNDVGIYPGVTIRSTDLKPPAGFARLAGNRWWTLASRC